MENLGQFFVDPRIDKPWGNTLREKLHDPVRLRYINWGTKERQQGGRVERGGRPSPAGGGAEEYRGLVFEISLLFDSNLSQLILVPLIRAEADSGGRGCDEGGCQHRAHGGAG